MATLARGAEPFEVGVCCRSRSFDLWPFLTFEACTLPHVGYFFCSKWGRVGVECSQPARAGLNELSVGKAWFQL